MADDTPTPLQPFLCPRCDMMIFAPCESPEPCDPATRTPCVDLVCGCDQAGAPTD